LLTLCSARSSGVQVPLSSPCSLMKMIGNLIKIPLKITEIIKTIAGIAILSSFILHYPL
jgi:hypothetical protein